MRAQELIAASGKPIWPGLLEMLSSAMGRVGDCLKSLPVLVTLGCSPQLIARKADKRNGPGASLLARFS
jgi:hypothetical protein